MRKLFAVLALLFFAQIAHATTFYRLPLQYILWNITYWMDHWQPPYVADANVRYDGTVILPGSAYYYGVNPRHRGTDFGVPAGNPVYVAASGTVAYVNTGCVAGNLTCGGGLGNWVGIHHADGMYSMYAHLSSVSVSVGQVLTCVSGPGGTLVGYSGNTGDSTAAHLHFELRSGLGTTDTSHDPFGGTLSQPFDYWHDWALVADPLRPGYQMHYPTTTCAP